MESLKKHYKNTTSQEQSKPLPNQKGGQSLGFVYNSHQPSNPDVRTRSGIIDISLSSLYVPFYLFDYIASANLSKIAIPLKLRLSAITYCWKSQSMYLEYFTRTVIRHLFYIRALINRHAGKLLLDIKNQR